MSHSYWYRQVLYFHISHKQEHLPPNATIEWVTNVFSEFGTVSYVSLPKFKDPNKIKGFAFVEFDEPESVVRAVKVLVAHLLVINHTVDPLFPCRRIMLRMRTPPSLKIPGSFAASKHSMRSKQIYRPETSSPCNSCVNFKLQSGTKVRIQQKRMINRKLMEKIRKQRKKQMRTRSLKLKRGR